jgi:hypothetical protein
MKVTQHVEHLLRQGRDPQELVELGFPKSVVTKVRRQLREEKRAGHARATKAMSREKGHAVAPAVSADNMVAIPERLSSMESSLKALEQRIGKLEAASTEVVSPDDLYALLDGTPALGLRRCFKCDCGASGFVAVRIKCTKCGRETWWGWFPKQ